MRFSDLFHFLKQVFFPALCKESDETELGEDDAPPSRFKNLIVFVLGKLRSRESRGITVSVFAHVVLLLILLYWMIPIQQGGEGFQIIGGFNELPQTVQEIEPQEKEKAAEFELTPAPVDTAAEKTEIVPPNPERTPNETETSAASVTDTADNTVEGNAPAQSETALPGHFVSGGGYSGRTAEGRAQAVGNGDCSAQSEEAVERTLVWLAAHQLSDGGWSFDFADSCKRCSRGGTHKSRIAATGIALLPFLGAGYTHQKGRYKNVIEKGLLFLIRRGLSERRGFALNHDAAQGMYSHGIAAMVLCEAYSMSQPKQEKLRQAAQESLRFTEEAQNRDDGGWRYLPNEPGDLSVSAWQVMALKSGKLAELHVSQPVIYEAYRFLDEVADDGGRQYNYRPTRLEKRYGTGSDSPKTCTSCGLLLRMYLGWKPGDELLDDGIGIVSSWEPLKENDSSCNLYYAYYATLALHHYGGSGWIRWNEKIRDFLVQTQSNRGDEAGSWFFSDSYCNAGGRLLNTALAALILETPYRIMPLFRKH